MVHKVFQSAAEMEKNNLQKPPDAIKSTGSLAIQVKFSPEDRGHFSHQDHKKKKKKGIKSLVLQSFYVMTKPLSIERWQPCSWETHPALSFHCLLAFKKKKEQ